MSWLEEHIETFVKPVVGEFDQTPLGYFSPEEHTVIKNAWRAVKASARKNSKRTILLPGRDVFIFEVLARRENYPTVFMPECSRLTVSALADQIGSLRGCYLFDTGFAGSIPRALRTAKGNFGLPSSGMLTPGIQVFPRLSKSRHLALNIEGTPKYWDTARMREGQIEQSLSQPAEFIRATRLTIEIYKNSSPKFVASHVPLARPIYPVVQ